ncbi:MAG TPA: histidine phosphatase family protein [Cyclobacteriaceae bacterium]|nr:histidine phosphatase family protein [Cyclobacteriaceae bacterium]
MQRKLYLVRHAQAEPGTALVKDEMRTLTSAGIAVSKQVGEFLKQKNSNLNLILASPAERTKKTSLLIAQQFTMQPEIRLEHTIYNGDVMDQLKLLTTLPDGLQEVMLVGHYPTVVDLHNYLASNNELIAMNTGELVALTIETNWQQLTAGAATFEYTFHPHLL